MKKHPLRGISTLVGVLLLASAALAACGVQSHAASTPTSTPHVPTGEILYVVDGAAASAGGYKAYGQRLVAFAAGGGAGAPLLSLPMGLTTLDHQRLYTATSAGATTTITIYATRTGARLDTFTSPGAYSMDTPGYTGALLSPDGRWLALRAITSSDAATTFALVDTQAQRLAQTIALPGSFDLDAISPAGGMLYLLQNLNDAAHHYYVRAYDLHARRLLDTIIVDKTAVDETKMQGTALTRQMASDGGVAYTLYINLAQNAAFIHVLPLGETSDSGLFAHCIDLPVPGGSAPDLLHFYTLALSADGATLYAANAALGLVSVISLHGQDVFNDQLELSGRFTPATAGATPGDAARTLYGGAALSPDQRTLYVAGLRGIWAVSISNLLPRQVYAAQQPFTGVALSGDGQRLYAADPDHGMLMLPLADGGTPLALQAPVRSPCGIAWIAG
jgi:DNA-binding beta-propeller fold protein YncE